MAASSTLPLLPATECEPSLAQGHRAGSPGAAYTLQPLTLTPLRQGRQRKQASVPASHLLVPGHRSRCGGLLSRRPRPSALPKFKAVLSGS